MARTDESKKKVYVKGHIRKDGTKIASHYRSTPNTPDGSKKTGKR